MTRIALWAVLILIVAYAFNINIPGVIGSVVHALTTMHASNGG
jgi:hypothetical protein